MTVKDYMDLIEKAAPLALAYEWDNVGLMTGDPSREVTGVLLCVDMTLDVLKEAEEQGANLIITHHPVIFDPLYSLGTDRASNRRIVQAIRQDAAVLSYHTNLDLAPAPYGVNYHLARALGLEHIRQARDGFHYYGELSEPLTASDFTAKINSLLDTKTGSLYNRGPEASVRRVGVSCGAYDEEAEWLSEYGCDALVTGEAKHSGIVDLSFEDLTVYLAGHYATELPGIRALADILPGRVFVSGAPAGDGALSK